MGNYESPKHWYEAATARPAGVPEDVIENRLEGAEVYRQSTREAGYPVTDEMISDEMLLITGRMDREEFNDYLRFKRANGGWQ